MAKSRNVIIVGNGLFGSIAATLARSRGHTVTVVSDQNPLAASNASGCVLAPSWLASLPKEHVEAAMGVLRELYTVEDLVFRTNLLKTFKASRVQPHEILLKPDIKAAVAQVGDGVVQLESGEKLRGHVLVAAGFWSQQLVQTPPIRALYGASLRFPGQRLDEPRIHVYAPYRQAVAVNMRVGRSDSVWVGDGTSLVHATWERESAQRIAATIERAQNLFGLSGKPQVFAGARPYVEGHKAGYFAQPYSKTWVSTGGAKNGTVLAAWQALQFAEALR